MSMFQNMVESDVNVSGYDGKFCQYFMILWKRCQC